MRDLAGKPRNISNPKHLFATFAYWLDFTAQDQMNLSSLQPEGAAKGSVNWARDNFPEPPRMILCRLSITVAGPKRWQA